MESLNIEDRIVAAIRRIIRAVDLHSRRLDELYGLTGPQLAVLQQTARLSPVSTGALARAVHLSHPTVTGIVDRLQRRALVQRTRGGPDRRAVLVSVTESGRRLLTEVPSLLQDRFRQALTELQDWEQTLMLSCLQRIAAMMDSEAIDAAPLLAPGATLDGDDDRRGVFSGEQVQPVDPVQPDATIHAAYVTEPGPVTEGTECPS